MVLRLVPQKLPLGMQQQQKMLCLKRLKQAFFSSHHIKMTQGCTPIPSHPVSRELFFKSQRSVLAVSNQTATAYHELISMKNMKIREDEQKSTIKKKKSIVQKRSEKLFCFTFLDIHTLNKSENKSICRVRNTLTNNQLWKLATISNYVARKINKKKPPQVLLILNSQLMMPINIQACLKFYWQRSQ